MAGDAGTKRKRDAGDKKKKSKDAAEVIQVTGITKPQFAAPVIATTPGIVVPDSVQFDSFAKPSKSAKRQKTADAELLLHASNHRSLDFTGKEEKAVKSGVAMQHYVGIFDPKTGKLEVVSAKKMEIRGTVRARDASEDQMTGVPVSKTNIDLRNTLGQTFGTKKAKKAIASITENAIGTRKRKEDGSWESMEMGAGDRVLMETMVEATSSMATREELQAVVDKAKPVPRGNYDAEEIQDVYVPSQIVGADVLASIPVRDWQQAARTNEPIDVYSRFVAQRVNHVAMRDDPEHLRLLRYMYWLILYWQALRPGKERGTKRQLPREKLKERMDGAPEPIIENIRRTFSDSGTVRKFHADLLATHCAAFACILDNYETDMLDLREDMKFEQKQMSQYFMEIGARMKVVKAEDKTKHVAKLALPLVFPNAMRQRQRK